MKVLVTGHRGYLGTAIVSELQDNGHEVSGLDADLFAAIPLLKVSNLPFPQRRSIPWVKKDIRDVTTADFQGVEAVIHLAGLSNDPLGALDPNVTFAINHDAAVCCAKAAKSAGVTKFLFASSCSVYGASDNTVLTETSSFAPVTAYAESKARAETEIAALADESFTPINLRSGTIYGATAMTRFDLVANNLVAWALSEDEIRMKSDGTAWRPIIHVGDVACAFRRVLEAPSDQTRGQAFNVANTSWNMQISEIAQAIKESLPACSITFSETADADQRNYKVDGTKLKKLIGDNWWSYEFSTALPELAEVLKPLKISKEDFEGATYQRVAHLKHLLASNVVDQDLRTTEEMILQ